MNQHEPVEMIQSLLEASIMDTDELLQLIRFAMDNLVDTDILRLFIQHDPGVAHCRARGLCLLYYACRKQVSPEIIKLLHKLNPNAIGEKDSDGWLPLFCACSTEDANIETVELLLSLYPDAISEVDKRGCLPLHVALRGGAPEEVGMILVEQYPGGALIKDRLGNLPLYYSFRHVNIVKALGKVEPKKYHYIGFIW